MPHNATLIRNIAQACETLQSIPRYFYALFAIDLTAQTPASLRFPYAIDVADEMMVVADTANNRVLVWDHLPNSGGVPADRVLAQPDFGTNGENRWDSVGADTLCWPYGLSLHEGTVAIADSGNNRIMIWELA